MKEVLNDAAEYAIVFEHFALLVFVDLIVKPLLLLLMYNVFFMYFIQIVHCLAFPAELFKLAYSTNKRFTGLDCI